MKQYYQKKSGLQFDIIATEQGFTISDDMKYENGSNAW